MSCSAASRNRFCVSDEHYVPTLLTFLGRQGESTCRAGVAYASWSGRNPSHPRTWTEEEAVPATVARMRGTCASNATADAWDLLRFARYVRGSVQRGRAAPPLVGCFSLGGGWQGCGPE